MFLGDELGQTFFRWDRRTGAGFGVVAPRATGFGVGEPIDGRDILVWSGHFDAGRAGNFRWGCRSGRDSGIRPFEIFENVEIHGLDFGRWRIVAAIEPDKDAGMVAEAGDLLDERGGGDLFGFGSPDLPVLPHITADPARHNEEPEAVGLVKKFVAVGLPFQANGV